MRSAPLPENETARINALKNLGILDTEAEFLYDDVTELASQICDTPICLVSLVDSDRQWFKSRHGLGAHETPREMAFCAHAILGREIFEIEDSRKDIRFHDNPQVTSNPNVVFYAGVPLDVGDGLHVGTLCVIDQKPKQLTDKQKTALRCLGNQVEAHLRLRRANLELQNALKAKSTFLASMSHEIRTPMNGIVGITNLLIESTKDRETKEQLHIIRNCSDILLTVLNDILVFSKIESGKVSFEAHAFNLHDLVKNVYEVLNPLASKKDLSIQLELGGEPSWLVSDSTRLSQILMNLIGNAIKFTAQGKVTLTVTKKLIPENKVELTFAIQDEGIGIPLDAQEKLFKSFSQVDASTTRKYGGTGLGLAIVKGLVEGMGGKIWLKSEPGKGSTFFFTLLCGVGTEPKIVPARASALTSELLGNKKTLRIMIAEDNRVNQIVAMKLISMLGYSADLAANGLEVLRMMESKKYDLILMDCQMPEMDGFEATEKIFKTYLPEKRPAIYALTAAVMEEERARCLSVGMKDVLHKPISIEALRRVLEECVSVEV